MNQERIFTRPQLFAQGVIGWKEDENGKFLVLQEDAKTAPHLLKAAQESNGRFVLTKCTWNKQTKSYDHWTITYARAKYLLEKGNLSADEVVDHIDNDKSNDDLDNLQAISYSENVSKDRSSVSPRVNKRDKGAEAYEEAFRRWLNDYKDLLTEKQACPNPEAKRIMQKRLDQMRSSISYYKSLLLGCGYTEETIQKIKDEYLAPKFDFQSPLI